MDEVEDEEGGVDPNPSQEQKTDMPQHNPQRVAFYLTNVPSESFMIERADGSIGFNK